MNLKASDPELVATDTSTLLAATPMLDHRSPSLRALSAARGWIELRPRERIGAIYTFVRDEIPFGYNVSDNLPASAVLADGIGQCNTKGTLLMALLRGNGIPCRLHGFTIDKRLQKGAVRGLAYWLAPRSILHSWVEVWCEDRWINLEGFILDKAYLGALQQRFIGHRGAFCGYGVATPDLQHPAVDWNGDDTYIQKDGINRDFGVFESPDAFYAQHGVNLNGARRWLFERVVRQWMNRNIATIRRAVSEHVDAWIADIGASLLVVGNGLRLLRARGRDRRDPSIPDHRQYRLSRSPPRN